jgi:hypothetical protein
MKITFTYVYELCTVPGNFVHNALYVWPGVGAGFNAANAVEYGTDIYTILQFRERYNTAFKNTAKSNITTFAYRTRTVCNTELNDYWYYYGEGTGTTRSGSNLLWQRDDRRRINGSGPKKRVRMHCESTIVVTVLA